jgi:predicted Rossmann fold flavoprotein
MQQIVILGGGAAGMAAALAAAQAAPAGAVRVTVLDRNPRCGKKLLATGNGRCNLSNTGIAPECYFTADPKALAPLLNAVNTAAPLEWFRALGLYTRTDEAGRVYPYSNQAADVLALLEGHIARLGVEVRTGCTVNTLSQNRNGYAVLFDSAERSNETLHADAVICAMGGNAGPQFGTDGFGTRFAAQCGGKLEPLYPCLTALQTARPNKALAGIRVKARAALLDLDRHTLLAEETGEVQFTDYGLSGICIMQLSGLLAPRRGPKRPAVELDLFPALDEAALTALFAARVPLLPDRTPADFWTGLLNPKLGRALWAAARLPDTPLDTLPDAAWQVLANTAKHWLFEDLTPCGWKQAQTTGGGLSLTELEPSFQFGAVLCGRNAGLRRDVRRLQPALGLRQRHHRRAGRRAHPAPPAQKEMTRPGPLLHICRRGPGLFAFFIRLRLCPAWLPPLLPPSGTPQRPTTWVRPACRGTCGPHSSG